jgi:hypothetical protein
VVHGRRKWSRDHSSLGWTLVLVVAGEQIAAGVGLWWWWWWWREEERRDRRHIST